MSDRWDVSPVEGSDLPGMSLGQDCPQVNGECDTVLNYPGRTSGRKSQKGKAREEKEKKKRTEEHHRLVLLGLCGAWDDE